ncbi:MAG: hypothetical protein KDA98_16435, partial [Acidimicrobiales bacterium]|nr:hypothetical protein [Acidimicrobiales bacterium]
MTAFASRRVPRCPPTWPDRAGEGAADDGREDPGPRARRGRAALADLGTFSYEEDALDRLVATVAAWARALWTRLGPGGVAASAAVATLAIWSGGGPALHRPALFAAGAASAACIAVAWVAPTRARVGWGAIAAGCVLWCAGSEARPMWQSADTEVAMTVGDLAALGSMLAFALGILALLAVPTRRVAQLRFAAEGLMVTASIIFASWLVLLPPAFAATADRPLREQVVLLAHAISAVLLLGVVAFGVTKLGRLGRSSLLLLGGVGAIAVLSSAMGVIDPSSAAEVGTVDLATALAFAAIVVAAVRAWHLLADAGDAPVTERAELLLLSAPGLSVLIVIGTTLRQVVGRPVADELTWITVGVLTLSVLLHLTVVVENHTLGAELALARDEAIHASELKSRFLANVSHEIRTPMNAVIGLTGLLLDTELEEDQRELAVGVATSAEGLLGLIDEVLDFSKIEAAKMELEEIDLDLTDLIDDVAVIVGDSARRKGIEVIAYCEPGMVTARRGDPVRLRQILLNLANNAVKFTEEGSVTIQAMPGAGGPDRVAFLVVDTGMGIPEAEQARLFEPFSQLDGSTTRTHGGTGLGLGIVRGLVELGDGTIELASEEGVGTVFRVTLPLPVGT